MATPLARLEADAHDRGMDPDTTEADLLGTIGTWATYLARWGVSLPEEEERHDRARLRGAMRAWLARTGADAGEAAGETAAGA